MQMKVTQSVLCADESHCYIQSTYYFWYQLRNKITRFSSEVAAAEHPNKLQDASHRLSKGPPKMERSRKEGHGEREGGEGSTTSWKAAKH